MIVHVPIEDTDLKTPAAVIDGRVEALEKAGVPYRLNVIDGRVVASCVDTPRLKGIVTWTKLKTK